MQSYIDHSCHTGNYHHKVRKISKCPGKDQALPEETKNLSPPVTCVTGNYFLAQKQVLVFSSESIAVLPNLIYY